MLTRCLRLSALVLFAAACSSSESGLSDETGDDADAATQRDGSATSNDASDTADAGSGDASDAGDAGDASDDTDDTDDTEEADAGDDAGAECINGTTLECYAGPAGTAGTGLCKAGTRVCTGGAWAACTGEVQPVPETCDGQDNDCDGVIDNGVQNACGGCSVLASAPGAACEDCGTVACDGSEAVVCVAPPILPGSACVPANGCNGINVCADQAVSCVALEQRNNCGVCGAAAVEGLDMPCAAANGCAGTTTCSADGLSARCVPVEEPNACGLCGGPAIVGTVNDACNGASGCDGVLVCNDLATALVCNAPSKNACDVCGGPVVTGIGDACTNADGCEGQLACSDNGTGTVCVSALTKNECGVCGPPVTGLGTACTTAADVPGTMACGPDGSAVCMAHQVLISEISGGNGTGSAATDEFVELYNPTSFDISIEGWLVQYRSATGTTFSGSVTLPAGATIAAKGYYLLAGGNYSGTGTAASDARYNFDMSASTTAGGHIRLGLPGITTASNDARTMDLVGWGTANGPEGSAAPSHPAAGGSLERKAVSTSTSAMMAVGGADALRGNGYDSGNNASDFVTRAIRNPQGSKSGTESP